MRRRSDNKAKTALEKAPKTQGWATSDEDEIALRRWRGRTDIVSVTPIEPGQPYFGSFIARSASGGAYRVEIRDLSGFANSCGCIDHRVNGLGTCKHVEGVLAALARARSRAFKAARVSGPARIEVFLDRRGVAAPAILSPTPKTPEAKVAAAWLKPRLDADGRLPRERKRLQALQKAWRQAPQQVARGLRISNEFGPWLDRLERDEQRLRARQAFEADIAAGRASLDILKFKLLPYQEAGALHLAFGERALLADDMGLGKTIQAIAAAELLARTRDIRRALVVCPASLKAEWEEQIARFCDRPSRLVFGPRADRLRLYEDPAFFTIVNYEQVVSDAEALNNTLKPDIVILDEAQRIKNWQTKTARRVKALRAPYAFVLTGTPVENRIDELYSIIQYLDPEVLGPLFRFNREFYELDERGRPVDYKNLTELRARIQPFILRRRKADVERDLPGRTVKNFFVPMAEEQRLRYQDYYKPAQRLIALARKRPLAKEEFERLQRLLACMRMVCDTPAILDPTCRISPKIEELERILEDLLEEPDRKIIVFSEWERMLALVRDLAREMGVEAAWHTGSTPQQRRRAEIDRFKRDPRCRLFLSTDSGSVGLNLQAASAVINCDLPWNPAKLEQRIARAWRKNQRRSVSVINLVAEDSIEHGMLQLLSAKQALAEGVIDGAGDLAALKMPSGRGAMIERMEALMAQPSRAAAPIAPSEEALVADLIARHAERALLIEAHAGPDGRARLLGVFDLPQAALADEIERLAEAAPFDVELIDRATWRSLQRLAAAGIVRIGAEARLLHRAAGFGDERLHDRRSDERETALRAESARALKMARVMIEGDFPEEAPALLAKAVGKLAAAVLARRGELPADVDIAADSEIRRLVYCRALAPDALAVLDLLAASDAAPTIEDANALADRVASILAALDEPAAQNAAAA